MKTKLILSLAMTCSLSLGAVTANAVPCQYKGTFTCTFTGFLEGDGETGLWSPVPSVPGLTIGDTFAGEYGYESETIDGIFGADSPTYLGYESFYAEDSGNLGPFPPLNFPNYYNGTITVAGGRVVSARDNHQAGPWIVSATFDTFAFRDTFYYSYDGFGTIVWSDPCCVPDVLGTISLLIPVCLALGLCRFLPRIAPAPAVVPARV